MGERWIGDDHFRGTEAQCNHLEKVTRATDPSDTNFKIAMGMPTDIVRMPSKRIRPPIPSRPKNAERKYYDAKIVAKRKELNPVDAPATVRKNFKRNLLRDRVKKPNYPMKRYERELYTFKRAQVSYTLSQVAKMLMGRYDFATNDYWPEEEVSDLSSASDNELPGEQSSYEEDSD